MSQREWQAGLTAVAWSFLSRFLTLPLSTAAAFCVTHTVSQRFGSAGFALYSVVVGLPALLPFSDLGLGAALTDLFATSGFASASEQAQSIIRRLWRFGLVVAALSVVIGATGLWSGLLGMPSSAGVDVGATVSVALFGLAIPLNAGHRALLGLGRNHTSILIQGTAAGVLALAAIVLNILPTPLWVLMAAPPLSTALSGAEAWRRVRILVPGLPPQTAMSGIRSFRKDNAGPTRQGPIDSVAPIWKTAGPMAIIGAALPVAYQSDRLVLAHFSTISAVAMYSAAAQLFTPLLSLVAVSGQALWPLFRARQSRSQAVKRSELLLYTAVFATIGALGALALVLAGPTAACWLTAGAVRPSGVLMAVFGSLLAIHAIHLPAGMLALDPAGMRFQAKTSTVMALVNVPLSILLAAKMGAAGPAIASAVSIAAVMLVPTQLRVYRQMNASGAL